MRLQFYRDSYICKYSKSLYLEALKNFYNKDLIEVGCDEAGRGCLAGPVFAGAVLLPIDFYHPYLNDSKQVNSKRRYELREIIEQEAIAWGIGQCSQTEIDELNILRASILAMHRAVESLSIEPEFLIIDGNRFVPYKSIPHKCFIKGDGRFTNIAAASILAKTYRDDYMKKIHDEFPQYNWIKNMGYPTREHKEAINKYGITDYHRKSFKLFSNQLSINFEDI